MEVQGAGPLSLCCIHVELELLEHFLEAPRGSFCACCLGNATLHTSLSLDWDLLLFSFLLQHFWTVATIPYISYRATH